MTVWIPLGDISLEEGTLMVCPNTHDSSTYAELHETYGDLDVDRDVPGDPMASGHLTDDPLTWEPKASHTQCWDTELRSIPLEKRQHWVTDDMRAGDCVIFGIKTLHMSTTNTTDRFRISCDTRWQPSRDAIDERWKGSPTDGEPHRFFVGDEPPPEENQPQLGSKAAKRAAAAEPTNSSI
jgi:ectoine hydroxylase-related dioxygenase (phytanoyl-CoA dioxygenase family)